MNTNNNLVVADTILQQLGGRMFLMMTGAKNLLGDERSLSMKLGSGAKCTHVRITLDPSDTYTVAFLKVRGTKCTTVAERSDVYAENLRECFERETGFRVSL